jgi:general secretion pathway protein K
MSRRRECSRRERGSVTILMLWGLALVVVFLSVASFTTRTEVVIARHALSASRARHAAEAGIQRGLLWLLAKPAAGAALFDGSPESWQDGSIRIEIAIQDEAGKIDINHAPLGLLSGLFAAIGRPRVEAILLACRVIERRGGRDDSCPEPIGSVPAGLRRNPLFAAPEELSQLPGFDEALYAAIADFVTVQTGASAIDAAVASRTVLLAVPGASPGLVDAFLAHRAMWRSAAVGRSLSDFTDSPFLMLSPGRDFTITAVATTADDARFRVELQVRLTHMAAHPYEVLASRAPPVRSPRRPPP